MYMYARQYGTPPTCDDFYSLFSPRVSICAKSEQLHGELISVQPPISQRHELNGWSCSVWELSVEAFDW
jgi:hypothetical protein